MHDFKAVSSLKRYASKEQEERLLLYVAAICEVVLAGNPSTELKNLVISIMDFAEKNYTFGTQRLKDIRRRFLERT